MTFDTPVSLNGGVLRLDAANVSGGGSVAIGAGAELRAVAISSVNLSGGTAVNGGLLSVNADQINTAPVTLSLTGNLLNNGGTVEVRGGDGGYAAGLQVTGGIDNAGVFRSRGPVTTTNLVSAATFNQQSGGSVTGVAPVDIDAPLNLNGGSLDVTASLNAKQGATLVAAVSCSTAT